MDPQIDQSAAATSQPTLVQPVPVPPVPPSPKSKLPLILIVIVLLVVVGAGGIVLGKYLAGSKTSPIVQSVISPVPTEIPTPTLDPTADWKTYTNTAYGYFLKYPSTLTVVPDTGMKEPKNLAEATGISIRNQSLADPLKSPQLNIYTFLPENTAYKGLITVKEIAEANFKENNHPETFLRTIEAVHETQFNGEVSYEYTMESKGFTAGWSGFLGEQGTIKIITLKHNEKYFQIGLYNTPVFDQILSTFRFD